MKHIEFKYGTPVFHRKFGLGVIVMDSYQNEDWANVEFDDNIKNIFKRDLLNSKEIISIITS